MTLTGVTPRLTKREEPPAVPAALRFGSGFTSRRAQTSTSQSVGGVAPITRGPLASKKVAKRIVTSV